MQLFDCMVALPGPACRNIIVPGFAVQVTGCQVLQFFTLCCSDQTGGTGDWQCCASRHEVHGNSCSITCASVDALDRDITVRMRWQVRRAVPPPAASDSNDSMRQFRHDKALVDLRDTQLDCCG